MDTDLGRAICFVTGAALISSDAVCLAVEHRLNGIVDAAEVGRLDLHHVAGSAVGKFPDVFERVAPFVGDQFDLNSAAV